MANEFTGNEAIFDNFRNIPGFDLDAQVALINKSQLFIDLLRFYTTPTVNYPAGTLTYNPDENQNGYNGIDDLPSIAIHDISGNNFVRILGHELGHAYDQLKLGQLTDELDNFENIIGREQDESEATAVSYIIRQQIRAANGPDIGMSNRIGERDPNRRESYLPEMDSRFGSMEFSAVTLDNLWDTITPVANWIWGKNFPLVKEGRTDSRWQRALNHAFTDEDYPEEQIPDFLQSSVRTFQSARINDNGQYEFIFMEQQGADAGNEIHYIYGANTGTNGPDLLVVGENDHQLQGGGGNDVLVGNWTRLGEEDDTGDVLDGGAGNDTLIGGTGSDTMIGGTGNDTFIIHGTDPDAQAFDTFNGGEGTDTILGGDQDDTIRVNSLSLG